MTPIRVLIADDERPARSFLASLLRSFDDVELVGEATNGAEALRLIEETRPDLALLDLQMPEVDGLSVVRLLGPHHPVLVVFVTAYDDHAIQAFEVHAVDYLLKPVSPARLREALNRAQERLERADAPRVAIRQVEAAETEIRSARGADRLERLPVRKGDQVILLPVAQIASVQAEGELLHVTTIRNDRHTISFRLKDLEERLDPNRFIRLSRGELANIEAIASVTLLPGGTYMVLLKNGQRLVSSRIQSRVLRDRLLRIR